jgi:twitching motility protein PilT
LKSLAQLLRSLERADVAELALVSDRLPCVRVGTSFDPIDEEAPTTEEILAMLVAIGGSRYVEALGTAPKQWVARVPGLGSITVSAVQRGQSVQARFSLARSPEPGAPSPSGKRASSRPVVSARRDTARPSRPAGSSPKVPSRTSRPAAPSSSSRRSKPAAREEVARRPAGAPMDGNVPVRVRESPDRRAPTSPAIPNPSRGSASPAPSRPGNEAARMHVRIRATPEPSGDTWPDADTRPNVGVALPSADLGVLLEHARKLGASDLHVVAGRPPLYRIGGELCPKGETLPAELVEQMVRPIVPARLSSVLAHEGSCDFALEHPEYGRFRVNVGRQQTGLKACLRLITRELPTVESLGLPADITRASGHHQGLVVFTGPTGHGKTTTLTAVVDHINRTTTHHVITVEDPIENVHPKRMALISQREIGTHTASFASALRAALREDPDVIVVGELRDTETVRMAVAASETGHLVLGTMNTPSAAKTIDRLIDLFPPADQPQVRLTLAAGLRLIVSQRLVPSPDRSRIHAAIELLPGSVPLSAIIRDNKTFQIPSLQQRGKGFGIVRLDESLADLVKADRVSLEDARLVAEAPAELETLVRGRPAAAAQGVGASR